MVCEKCKSEMSFFREDSIQGWQCSICDWNVVTTHIDDMLLDMTEYSICIKKNMNINIEKIKLIAKMAGVNFIMAKKMLEMENVCVLKARATEIKNAIAILRELDIEYEISPLFKY